MDPVLLHSEAPNRPAVASLIGDLRAARVQYQLDRAHDIQRSHELALDPNGPTLRCARCDQPWECDLVRWANEWTATVAELYADPGHPVHARAVPEGDHISRPVLSPDDPWGEVSR